MRDARLVSVAFLVFKSRDGSVGQCSACKGRQSGCVSFSLCLALSILFKLSLHGAICSLNKNPFKTGGYRFAECRAGRCAVSVSHTRVRRLSTHDYSTNRPAINATSPNAKTNQHIGQISISIKPTIQTRPPMSLNCRATPNDAWISAN